MSVRGRRRRGVLAMTVERALDRVVGAALRGEHAGTDGLDVGAAWCVEIGQSVDRALAGAPERVNSSCANAPLCGPILRALLSKSRSRATD